MKIKSIRKFQCFYLIYGVAFQVHHINKEKLEEHDSGDKNTTKVTQTYISRNEKVDFFLWSITLFALLSKSVSFMFVNFPFDKLLFIVKRNPFPQILRKSVFFLKCINPSWRLYFSSLLLSAVETRTVCSYYMYGQNWIVLLKIRNAHLSSYWLINHHK